MALQSPFRYKTKISCKSLYSQLFSFYLAWPTNSFQANLRYRSSTYPRTLNRYTKNNMNMNIIFYVHHFLKIKKNAQNNPKCINFVYTSCVQWKRWKIQDKIMNFLQSKSVKNSKIIFFNVLISWSL
jgi:hypothetical protein